MSNKKWLLASAVITAIMFSVSAVQAEENIVKSDMNILLHGSKLPYAKDAYLVNSSLFVPYRVFAESIGATVDWNNDTRTAIVKKGSSTIQVPIGAKQATVNGQKKELEEPATIIDESTYVPVRFMAESLGLHVQYDDSTRTVSLHEESAAAVNEKAIQIQEFAFSPETITIVKGTMLVFTNKDDVEHTATADGLFDSGDLKQGETFSYSFEKAGTYTVYCKPHPFMKMKVTVTDN